jgi:predicted PurR-regulated permease PerM
MQWKKEETNGPGTNSGAPGGTNLCAPAPVSPQTALVDFTRQVVVAVLILALTYLLWRGMHVLLLAFAGVLFAIFLSALSDWLRRQTGLRYGKALAAVIAALALMTVGLGWLLANRLAAQAAELSQKLPQSLQQIRDYLEAFPWGRLLLEKAPQAAQSLTQAGDFSRVTGLVSGVANFLVAGVVILFVGIFGAAEPEVYKNGLLHLVPQARRQRIAQALDAVVYNLRAWMVGQVCLMVLMAVTTALALWLLGIPMALMLGLIAGILELLPYIGAWLSAVPAALIALLVGPGHLLMTLLLFLALHILEGYILVPLIQRRSVSLPPALTLIAQLLCGELGGVLGVFVAAPLTVAVIVFLKMLYVEDTLGDKSVEVPGNADEPPSTGTERSPAG